MCVCVFVCLYALTLLISKLGETLTLRCSFVSYPTQTTDVIWLADYGNVRRALASSENAFATADDSINSSATNKELNGRLPSEQRLTLLYDSRLHNSSRQVQPQVREAAIYGNRVIIRDSSSPMLKKSQLVIGATHVDDSAL